MKARMLTILALAITSGPVFAANGYVTPAEIAEGTGLTARQVAMVLGPSTGYPEFVSSYTLVSSRLRKALGDQRYEELRAANADTKLPARMQAGVNARARSLASK